jgi:hypothetical protein
MTFFGSMFVTSGRTTAFQFMCTTYHCLFLIGTDSSICFELWFDLRAAMSRPGPAGWPMAVKAFSFGSGSHRRHQEASKQLDNRIE